MSDTLNSNIPIGPDGHMLQLTTLSAEEHAEFGGGERTTLLTVRAGKDTELTEQQLRALAAEALRHADFIAGVAGG